MRRRNRITAHELNKILHTNCFNFCNKDLLGEWAARRNKHPSVLEWQLAPYMSSRTPKYNNFIFDCAKHYMMCFCCQMLAIWKRQTEWSWWIFTPIFTLFLSFTVHFHWIVFSVRSHICNSESKIGFIHQESTKTILKNHVLYRALTLSFLPSLPPWTTHRSTAPRAICKEHPTLLFISLHFLLGSQEIFLW